MGRIDNVKMNLEIGVRWDFECWGPMTVETPVGLDIDVRCPFTGAQEFRLVKEAGEVFEVPKGMYEQHLEPYFPIEILKASELRWVDGFENLVVTGGRNEMLDTFLNDSAPSAGLSWYVGLKDTGTPAAADTMASHGTWSELSAIYSDGTRPGFSGSAASSGSVDNSGSKASFSITSSDDVFGAFLVNESTKGATNGILYGAGDFGAERGVQNGDTLNVTVTAVLTSS